MAFKGQHCVVTNHSFAVVGNFQQPSPAGFDLDRDARRAGVDCVFDQLLERRRGPLDHLAGGDAVDQLLGQATDRHGLF